MILIAIAIVIAPVITLPYLYLRRLNSLLVNTRYKNRKPYPSDVEILRDGPTYNEIDMFAGTEIAEPTHKRYLILGGAGSVGAACVKLLVDRGEKHIVAADVGQMPRFLKEILAANKDAFAFIKLDIVDKNAVNEAFRTHMPDVVIHFASVIRFFERSKATYHLSARVNIDGTQNLLNALCNLPSSAKSDKIFVYCSTAGLCFPRNDVFWLDWRWSRAKHSYKDNAGVISDEDNLPDNERCQGHYSTTKLAAERLVLGMNGKDGLKTAAIRPGMGIQGPQDISTSMYFQDVKKSHSTFASKNLQTNVCVQDCAMAHLLCEHALRQNRSGVAGEAFLVTGERDPWSIPENMHALLLFAPYLKALALPILPLFLGSYVMEFFVWARYSILMALHNLRIGPKPALYPDSLIKEHAQALQPAAFDTALLDAIIDDSRARKVLGYKPKWSNSQQIKWIVDHCEEDMKRQGNAPAVLRLAGNLKQENEDARVDFVTHALPAS